MNEIADPGLRYAIVTLPELVGGMILAGVIIGVALTNHYDAWRTWRRLKQRGLNGGFLLLAWTHVWGSGARVAMAVLLLLSGLLLFFRYADAAYWPALAVLIVLAQTTIRARFDRDRASDLETDHQDAELLKVALATPPPYEADGEGG